MLLVLSSLIHSSLAESKIKDIVSFEGIRDNILVGDGLVVGLEGTGDNLKTKNIAAVMVSTTLSTFARTGSKTSVTSTHLAMLKV